MMTKATNPQSAAPTCSLRCRLSYIETPSLLPTIEIYRLNLANAGALIPIKTVGRIRLTDKGLKVLPSYFPRCFRSRRSLSLMNAIAPKMNITRNVMKLLVGVIGRLSGNCAVSTNKLSRSANPAL